MKKRSDKKIYFVLAIILVAGVVLGSKLTGLIALQGSLTKSPSTCTGAWDSCSGAFNRDGGTSAAYLETKDEEDTGRWGGFGFQIPSLSTIRNARLTLKLDLAKLIGNETGKARNIPANYFGGYIEYRVSGDGGRTFGPSHVVDYNTLISKKGKEDFEIGGSSLGRRQDVYWDLFTASLINDITLVPSSFNNDNLVVELTCFNPYREGAPLERGGHERTYCMADWIAVTLDFSYVTTTTTSTSTSTTTTSTTTTSTTTTTLPILGLCTDSDGGANILIKGVTTMSGTKYVDYCGITGSLTEFYCTVDSLLRETFSMRGYSCSLNTGGKAPYCYDGACVSSLTGVTTSTTCTDTDNGKNTAIRGNVYGYSSGVYYNREDYCSIGSDNYWRLVENYCYLNSSYIQIFDCATITANGVCLNGACVSGTTTTTTTTLPTLSTCTDTDGGQNIFVQGTVTGKYYSLYNYPTFNPVSYTDRCNGNTLTEWYCSSGGSIVSSSLGCNFTRSTTGATPYCDNGKCVSSTSTTTTTLPYTSNSCTDSDGGNNYGTKGRVYGYSNWYYGTGSYIESDINTGYYSIADTCFSDIHLLEESCSQDGIAPRGNLVSCSFSYAPGSICRDGACVSGTTTT